MNTKLNCILLIDDDEPTNFISNMIVEEANCTHHVHIAYSGQNALDYLEAADEAGNSRVSSLYYPQLIFLDINMPAMDGWEFLEKYTALKSGYHKETVIIMLTTSLNPDDKIKACNMACVTAFETKPLTNKLLISVIEKHFSASA